MTTIVNINKSRSEFESYLNEFGVPERECKSNGGRCPDIMPYGTWLRHNDPIAFNVAFNEWTYRTEVEKVPYLFRDVLEVKRLLL